MWMALSLSVATVAYNNIANRWAPFHRSAYVPLNLIFAGAITGVAVTILDLSWADVGLRGDGGDAGLSLAVVALFSIAAFTLARSRHAHRITDSRVIGLRGRALAFYVIVRIPIGTAVVEEVVFRGLLFAAWRETGAPTLLAALLASAAFGLWHITPTIVGFRMNDPAASRPKLGVAVVAAVLLTTIAGLGLTWLRLETGGLVGPIVLHAGINSISALAAVTASSAHNARIKESG